MADIALPTAIVNWMRARNWGEHHVEWHAVRQWDRLSTAARAAATARGWSRYPIQEGTAGNGLEFLVMHRAMLELLRAAFPADAALFAGWAAVPTDPADANDPVPPLQTQVFDPDKKLGVDLFQTNPGFASSDDAFGIFLETMARPLPGFPRNVSTNRQTGLHNYLHNRFSDDSSPINLGDPTVNIENERFWKLHGWIDNRWIAFREAKGLAENDPTLRTAIDAAKTHMAGAHHGGGHLATAPVFGVLPQSLRQPFRPTLSADFEALRNDKPKPKSVAEVCEYLQVAIRLELATLPLYLTAQWSLKSSPNHSAIIGGIAIEEMLHMGLACNLLVALGGVPEFASAAAVVQYPDHLPGIEPTAPFVLEAFSVPQVNRFLEIEKPAHGPIPDELAAVPNFRTIGDFYAALLEGLTTLNPTPTFDPAHQIAADLFPHALFKIQSMNEAKEAIRTIVEQGEGTTQSQGAAGPDGPQLAHYYAFNQMIREMYYTRQADGKWKLDPAKPLPLPAAGTIREMAPIPVGGYPDVPAAVAFDRDYSDMLRALQNAWTGSTPTDDFDRAVELMRGLRSKAVALMNTPRTAPYLGGNFGPAFRFVPPTN